MGLDTTHNAWHGAYSAFGRWRNRIAEAGGYKVEKFDDGFERAVINWDAYHDENYQGVWQEMPSDPLLILIVHSDCEGEIKPEHALPLAERLERLLPILDGDGGGHIGLYREKTESFIAGLRAAAAAGEPVEFR